MTTQPVHEQTVAVDGMTINYCEAGAGSPLVLFHGGGVDSASISWGTVQPGLAAAHRVIAPDLPGYGKSDKPDITYSQEFYIDFIGKFLDALHLDRVSLAGLSLGGGISLGFTLAQPVRVHKLILVDSAAIMEYVPYHKLSYIYATTFLNEFSYWVIKKFPSLVRKSLTASIFDPANITDDLVAELTGMLQDPQVGKAFASYQRDELRWNGIKTNYLPLLSEIATPTLILHGDQDMNVPLQWVDKAHAGIRGSQLVILKNRKHWSLRDHPEEIVQLMLDFLAD
jgi:pimeloyl-ACP methyl ester carboxylesterase